MLLFAVVASAGSILTLSSAEAQMSGATPPQLNGTILNAPSAAAQQILHGHVPEVVARLHLQPIGRLQASDRLNLAIGLPLRNKEALNNLLEQLYDPASTNYHHYLTPPQFTERFGPTEQDYQSVIAFVKTSGLAVAGTYPNRALVDVNGSVADIEKVFHVTMHVYQHPKEHRTFYAPDTEPSPDLKVPLLHISGLDNYVIPHPAGLKATPMNRAANTAPADTGGSGPNGEYMGKDFRNSYVPGATLDGTDQEVGLFEYYGYYPQDIANYEFIASPLNVLLTNVLVGTNIILGVNAVNGNPDPFTGDDTEAAVDIEMVISMAPRLSKVVIYEGYDDLGNNSDAILNTMANDTNNTVKQFSCSWIFSVDANAEQSFQQFITQGQSFFQASGDGDAWVGSIKSPCDDPYITIVGGTVLTMNGSGASYASETVWNEGYDTSGGWPVTDNGYWGSGGGISTNYPIPVWQQGVDMSNNGGSTTMRNIPDVAMVATNIFCAANNAYGGFHGTSAAAPLWAGFTALVNQQCALNNPTNRVGFLNPALYRIGKRPPVSVYPFHDIVSGNNTWSGSQYAFYAVPGYDLCTGWGTPNGTNLINALVAMPPVLTNQPQSQSATVGSTVILNVGVTGTSPFSYQWFWNDSLYPLHDGGQISGSLTSTLTITNVQTTNAGSYFVVVGNPATYMTSGSAVLNVYVTAPPSQITFDDLVNTAAGLNVPSGYRNFNWYNFGYLNARTNNYNPSGYPSSMVSPNNVAFNWSGTPAGIYVSTGSFNFVSAYLTAAWNNNLQVEAIGYNGSTVIYNTTNTLSATTPTLINFNFLGVTEVDFYSSGGTQHSGYTTSGEQFAIDNITVTTNLAIETPPQIITQPTNQTAIAGTKATFTVSATGTAPLNYQWLKNGNTLANGGNIFSSATSSLIVSNISTTDIGVYSVIVSNPYGSVVSTNAGLSVYVAGSSFLIPFDDLATPDVGANGIGVIGPIPANYNGVNWNNIWVLDAMDYPPISGYQAGMISTKNVAFNDFANPASITSTAPFNFLSAYLTAAWYDNLQVEVQGYVGSILTYDNTYTLSATAPTLINFNYLGVNEVYFSAFGGTQHASYSYNGEFFAMDNVTIATNIAVSVLPTVQTMTKTGSTITLGWGAIVGQTYQVQYKTNLTQTGWNNLGAPIIAMTSTIYLPDSTTNSQRFYRIVLMP